MTDTKVAVVVDSEEAAKLREWFKSGRGVKQWSNAEIASDSAQHTYTPGDCIHAPNWRYIHSTDLQPSDITVRSYTVLETFRGRFKAMYWGPWVQPSTEAKAERLCAKHSLPKGSWQWRHDDTPGYVIIEIVLSDYSAFTVEGTNV